MGGGWEFLSSHCSMNGEIFPSCWTAFPTETSTFRLNFQTRGPNINRHVPFTSISSFRETTATPIGSSAGTSGSDPRSILTTTTTTKIRQKNDWIGSGREPPDAGRRTAEGGNRREVARAPSSGKLGVTPPPLPPSGGGRRLNMKMNHTIGFATRFWITIQCDG